MHNATFSQMTTESVFIKEIRSEFLGACMLIQNILQFYKQDKTP